MMWERFTEAVDATRGMLTAQDVEEAIRASNFNTGLGLMGSMAQFSSLATQATAYPGNHWPDPRPARESAKDPQIPLRGETGAPLQE